MTLVGPGIQCTLRSIILPWRVQARVTNQIYPPRQALDPRYQVCDLILTKYINMLTKDNSKYQIHAKHIQERHFLRIKASTPSDAGVGGCIRV